MLGSNLKTRFLLQVISNKIKIISLFEFITHNLLYKQVMTLIMILISENKNSITIFLIKYTTFIIKKKKKKKKKKKAVVY